MSDISTECEAPKTSGMSIEPLYIVIAVVAIGGGAGAIFILKQIQEHQDLFSKNQRSSE